MDSAILKFNVMGECEINADKVCSLFSQARKRKNSDRTCRDSFISKWNNEYTLCDVKNGISTTKIKISEQDALSIIKKLGLVAISSGVFRNATTFRLTKQ